MSEDPKIHARTVCGQALCGKPLQDFSSDEILQGPGWDGVTCPACNEQRVLIKAPEDLRFANEILSRFK